MNKSDKGVICKIAEPHEMPVDENGVRADIVMDPGSTISRMNIGRLYEQYINSSSDMTVKVIEENVCGMLGIDKTASGLGVKLAELENLNDPVFMKAWDYLLNFYKITSPIMYNWFTNGQYTGSRADHLHSVIKNGIFLYLPPDNSPESTDIVRQLEKQYRPPYGSVEYIGSSGKKVKTVDPVRIGSMYIMLLEKTADDWTAVSSGKLQAFGVLSQRTNSDKYSTPVRNQAIRALGEAEVRIYVSYVGPKVTADILDRNNNPASHAAVLESILTADQPTNIDMAVDRKKIPIGFSKPLKLVRHIAQIAGFSWKYKPYKPDYGVETNPDWNK